MELNRSMNMVTQNKSRHQGRGIAAPFITTSTGAPIENNQTSLSAGPRGPILIGDFHLLDKLAHFDRERIPERVVHAKGAGAYGTFTVTGNVKKYCKARMFNPIGKTTPLFIRFSTVGGESGSADTTRDPRGFAVKFYTEDGVWDLVGNNTPIFFIRDALKFPDFIHTQKRNPRTNLPDPDAFWDFLSLVPESIHQVTILFSDRGTPDGYRHMNGYGSHAYKTINAKGDVFYVKFHLKTKQGIKNLTAEQAAQLSATDPNHATRDLFRAIEEQDYPSWTMYWQIMPHEEAKTASERLGFDILDVTKIWPHSLYPLHEVGTLVLNRNVDNYHNEIEQAAFAPSHLVPGIEPSEDRMLQGRLFSYIDTHRYRLGKNYNELSVNSGARVAPGPRYQSDYHVRGGFMASADRAHLPNYEPNSVPGAPRQPPPGVATTTAGAQTSTSVTLGVPGRYPFQLSQADFKQPRELYARVMTDRDREHLIANIVAHLRNARKDIQERQCVVFARVHPDYGKRVAKGLGLSIDLDHLEPLPETSLGTLDNNGQFLTSSLGQSLGQSTTVQARL